MTRQALMHLDSTPDEIRNLLDEARREFPTLPAAGRKPGTEADLYPGSPCRIDFLPMRHLYSADHENDSWPIIGGRVFIRGARSARERAPSCSVRSSCRLPYVWKMRREVLEQMHVVLIGSMPLVLVTSVFVGAVTAVQAVYQMQALVPMKFLGVMISKTVFIELGPVLMALVVGSRLCAFYAAELGP